MNSGNNWWRALIAIAVVIALPALAMPKVSNAVNDWLYGDSKGVVPPLPELKPQAEQATKLPPFDKKSTTLSHADFQEDATESLQNSPVALATFSEAELDNATPGKSLNSDFPPSSGTTIAAPPLLAPPTGSSALPATTPADSLVRVRGIRDELASLGAEYILLEALDDGQKFRFCCLMADPSDPQVTFPFEATAPDAGVAAQSVFSAVQAWRQQQGVLR